MKFQNLFQEFQDFVHFSGREGLLVAGFEVLQVHRGGLDFGGAVDGDEGDGLLGGVVELLLELARFGVDFDGDAGFAEGLRQGQDVPELLGAHHREQEPRRAAQIGRELVQALEDIIDAVRAEGDAHAGDVREAEDAGEVVVAAAAADAADGEVQRLHLEDRTGVVVEAAGEGKVDLHGLRHAGRADEAEQLLELVQALEAGGGNQAGGGAAVEQAAHGGQFFGSGAGEQEDGPQDGDGVGRQALLQHLGLDALEPDLVQLVDGDGDVHHPLREAADLREAGEDLAVVDLDAHADTQKGEHAVHHLHQLELVDLRGGADHVHVALVELAVAALLRPVRPPDGLDLVPLEREGNLVLVLDHVAGERDGQVVPQALLGRQLGLLAAVLDAEQELVALVAVLAQKRGEVLHRGRFDLLVAIGPEHAPDGVEYVIALGHLALAEVTGSLGDGRFLCHGLFG